MTKIPNNDAGKELPNSVAQRVHNQRKRKQLSIQKLSSLSGVSVGMISQIERGKTNPSLKLLEKLRQALGVSLSELLEDYVPTSPSSSNRIVGDSGTPSFVRRASERPHFLVGKIPLEKELLSPVGMDGLEMMIIHFPPKSANEDVIIAPGQKAGLVLAGKIDLIVDGVDVSLGRGDSFQFDSTLPHSIRNEYDKTAQVLWIMSPFRQALF